MAKTKEIGKPFERKTSKVIFEITTNGFGIGKIKLSFHTLEGEGGSCHIKESCEIYLKPETARSLAERILSPGKQGIKALGDAEIKRFKEAGDKYTRPVWEGPIGGSVKPGSASICRQMLIMPGTKKPWVLTAKYGEGKQTETGGIVFAGKTTNIYVPLESVADLDEFAAALQNTCDRFNYCMAMQDFGKVFEISAKDPAPSRRNEEEEEELPYEVDEDGVINEEEPESKLKKENKKAEEYTNEYETEFDEEDFSDEDLPY